MKADDALRNDLQYHDSFSRMDDEVSRSSSGLDSVPKLGDFTKLRLRSRSPQVGSGDRHAVTSPVAHPLFSDYGGPATAPARLGNFAKLASHFRNPSPNQDSDPFQASELASKQAHTAELFCESKDNTLCGKSAVVVTLLHRGKSPSLDPKTSVKQSTHGTGKFRQDLQKTDSETDSVLKSISDRKDKTSQDATDTQETTPESLTDSIKHQRTISHPHISVLKRKAQRTETAHKAGLPSEGKLLSYQLVKFGTIYPVYGPLRDLNEKHTSLTKKLILASALDTILAKRQPTVTSRGVHVFVDMSNINISFHEALRRKHSIHERARLQPLPSLNLAFLHEILIRGRETRSLHVGCSVRPGYREPRYVQDFRQLGYIVDLRERKAVESSSNGCWKLHSSSSDEGSRRTMTGTRYVEDLVDETLQTRIGEAVMEYFQEQGTIVLATGDAQPAQYSDGFFTYADRALRMGWNVEVVSWNSSLSSNWRNPDWVRKWGDRFRILQLDEFVDDLLI